MLKALSINNYALINQSQIELPSKLTVITGETGAGKSILLGALGLVLGNRADSTSLFDATKKCVIEAVFDISDLGLVDFFNEHDLDYEVESTLRREITAEGKSRAFINDTPVNLAVVKEMAAYLIDIHSQHQTLLLNESNFQFNILDSLANSHEVRHEYQNLFKGVKAKEKKLADYQAQQAKAKADLDYYTFLFNELDSANIKEGELKVLEQDYINLSNAEGIKQTLNKVNAALSEDEMNIVTQLSTLKVSLNSLNKFGDKYTELSNRLNSALIELKDISDELVAISDDIVYSNEKMNLVNEKLDAINRLLKKHNVKTDTELIETRNDIEQKLSQIEGIDELVVALEKEIKADYKKIDKVAEELNKLRNSCVSKFEKETNAMLLDLSMPNAQFKVDISYGNEYFVNGKNTIQFLFSANKGAALANLQKVASGGELARLMLCLKAQLAKSSKLPTIIFDEIDTGISGDVANKVGIIMEKMGANMQVVSITHLPQIASKGDSHLFVYKEDSKNKTQSFIKKLSKEERIIEVAKMLSTDNPTEAAIGNAKELLGA